MAQFVTLDSRRAKAHSAPSREALLAQWEAQSRRAETEALSAVPDAALGRRGDSPAPHLAFGMETGRILAAAVADAQQRKATFSRYELTRMINRYLPDYLGGLPGEQVTGLLEELTDAGAAAGRPGGHGAADRTGDGARAAGVPARRRAEPVAQARRRDLHHPRHAGHRDAPAARRGADRRAEACAAARRRGASHMRVTSAGRSGSCGSTCCASRPVSPTGWHQAAGSSC